MNGERPGGDEHATSGGGIEPGGGSLEESFAGAKEAAVTGGGSLPESFAAAESEAVADGGSLEESFAGAKEATVTGKGSLPQSFAAAESEAAADGERLARALERLPDWFSVNARDLPWRKDRDPYHVWISEIMLQQTRVETVKGYYERFLAEFPTVEALAACDEERLLKLWEGLGYYSRARNLRRAAQTIAADFGGEFPNQYEEILSLSGIGPYTAGAVSSIAFRRPKAAVDGNVLRVLSRLCDDARDISDEKVKKDAAAGIEEVLAGCIGGEDRTDGRGEERTDGRGEERTDGRGEERTDGRGEERTEGRGEERTDDRGKERTDDRGEVRTDDRGKERTDDRGEVRTDIRLDPGIVNQALMELGAIVCVPNGAPHCEVCPWADLCLARAHGTIAERPVKVPRAARRIERRTILLITDGSRLFLHRRPSKGLLAGMYEPVNLEGHLSAGEIPGIVRGYGFAPLRVVPGPDARHVFTHIEWEMISWLVNVEEPEMAAAEMPISQVTAFHAVAEEMPSPAATMPCAPAAEVLTPAAEKPYAPAAEVLTAEADAAAPADGAAVSSSNPAVLVQGLTAAGFDPAAHAQNLTAAGFEPAAHARNLVIAGSDPGEYVFAALADIERDYAIPSAYRTCMDWIRCRL